MEYGEALGTVTSVSANSINPLDTAAVQSQIQAPQVPGAPQDLYYQVNASLDVLNCIMCRAASAWCPACRWKWTWWSDGNRCLNISSSS